ncbi:MAG: helix-turn-helix domain containing protein [Puniceicoccales bacterium]|nr:helix-turn-helix domain containing protein [Puniceicoccales bacterium]
MKKSVLKYESTHTVKEASETFGVSVRAIFEWKKKLRRTGNLETPGWNNPSLHH